MKPSDQFYLFFCTSIQDHSRRGNLQGIKNWHKNETSFLFRWLNLGNLDSKADEYLAESRYWLKGKNIKLFDDYIHLTPFQENYLSTLDKVKSLVKAILFFIPGICLKILEWGLNFSYIQQRNRAIFRSLNDLATFAQASKSHYAPIADFSSDPTYQYQSCPNLIIQALGKANFFNLPISTLPDIWYPLFKKAAKIADLMEENDGFTLEEIEIIQWGERMEGIEFEKQLCQEMGNSSLQKIQFGDHSALIIRTRDNSLNQQQPLVITKIKNKWMVISYRLPGGLGLFLNDIRFYENDSPLVEDYFKRLFKGEPCGNFSSAFNKDIPVNYQVTKAANCLREGLRVCADGITPVMQLWPPLI